MLKKYDLVMFPEENPNPVLRLDINGHVIFKNKATDKILAQAGHKNIFKILPKKIKQYIRTALRKKTSINDLEVYSGFDAYTYSIAPLVKNKCVNVYGFNITARKVAEEQLKMSRNILSHQKESLEKKNLALTEVLERFHAENIKTKHDIISQLERTVYPILKKIEHSLPENKYLEMIRNSISRLKRSTQVTIIDSPGIVLSPREREICTMLQNDLNSKGIAEVLNISLSTVEKHRRNIRKKLSINSKKVNLSSYVKTSLPFIK